MRNDGTISAPGHSQSTGAKNFLIIPRKKSTFLVRSVSITHSSITNAKTKETVT